MKCDYDVMTFVRNCPDEYHILENKGIISSAIIIEKGSVYHAGRNEHADRDEHAGEKIRHTSEATHRLVSELCSQAKEDGCNALCGVSVSYSAGSDGELIIGASAEEVIIENNTKTEKLISNAISAVSAVNQASRKSGSESGEYFIRINSVKPENEDELTVILAGLMTDSDSEELLDVCDSLPYMIKGRFNAVAAFDAVNKMSEQGIDADILDDSGQLLYNAR
ncbi:MAG: hypothetical protein KBH85_07955 [Lachnospiraceae bacterium]|jgi:uncharacterized protein YbjQ (UPF0145 family)|nr:hypothetical protein [Lachnospiraceae bacterium]